ncbi:tyrosine-protein kinase family protein [Morganella morganii]|uniref:tyrosine-protein kinase family protein n=3 Tax=Enterobacterales TaxID=91347 RepID=UPI000290E702|nr:AAA family ATPase [Morganella morganii]AVK38717.1 cobQ/CobB/MinD/ParA nucleotide binding domain protein [Morganella morganii]ELO7537166.1 AAA family ATPase [Morganella morganii]EMP52548.1 hypothetical protein C790_03521 [Morganella morganii SC01]MBN4018146.1 AAA family ATPase [Morganella morganii]MBO8063700.1 AAA family ATPase [Morganella morganii]
MLKSIDFIKRLEMDLNDNIETKNIIDFFIELRINQDIDIYIASEKIKSTSDLFLRNVLLTEFDNNKLHIEIIDDNKYIDEDYKYLFEGDKTSYGLRRSLSALLNIKNDKKNKKHSNLITFYSYKGGVGRTTSLALTATYLARKGNNVFVIDCDFEAPGLINFFKTSQSDNNKNGLVEYLNDKLFVDNCNIDDYIYNIEKTYSGNGSINLMPAGNILSNQENTINYLEGLAKIDLQGDMLVKIFDNLINDIKKSFSPDIILVDSRTGFNNTFGSLAQLSNHVVVLAGDDIQNQPGLEFVAKTLNECEIDTSFILSIISSNYSRRYNNFIQQIHGLTSHDTEIFYFDRQNTLEFIGTPLEDNDDLNDFINGENGSGQYQKFFSHINQILKKPINSDDNIINLLTDDTDTTTADSNIKITSSNVSLQDNILNKIKDKLPNLYAENINYSDEYVKKHFYYRQCMEDLFIPEKTLLLGDKGTGKTAFYKVLQNEDFFSSLITKSQKSHLNIDVLNITNFDNDNFEFIGFDNYIKDELFIKKFWMYFIWLSLKTRSKYLSSDSEYIFNMGKFDVREKIINVINTPESYAQIESDLSEVNKILKHSDSTLIITFDYLDNIVKPFLWNDVISPLVKIAVRFPYENIQPKLFLRRDLYERLGNLTNKNSFSSRIINLEWSQNEIFSYFLKIIFIYSYDDFYKFLSNSLESKILLKDLPKKLRNKKTNHNQLPLDTHIIKPIVNAFFGSPRPKRNGKLSTAYDDLYRNIQSADKTVNLRPFIDLITSAIEEQEIQDFEKKYRMNSIIGLAYCTSKQVRKKAVVNYLEDLWNEKGNEIVKYFCMDFSNNKIDPSYKKNILSEELFEKLLIQIKTNNSGSDDAIKNGTIEEFKQILIANKIITPYMVGNKTRYGFAYLYTNFLGI